MITNRNDKNSVFFWIASFLPMTSLRILLTISVSGLLRKLAMTVGIHCHFWLFDFLMPIRNDGRHVSSLRWAKRRSNPCTYWTRNVKN